MKTTSQKLFLFLLAVVVCERLARADVTSYAIFKVANFQQTSPAPPAGVDSPNAYYFGAQLFATNSGELITDAAVTAPDATNYPMPGNPVPAAFYYNSPYYPDDTSFSADYPGGNYLFTVNDGTDSGLLTEPVEELYSTDIPYFTGDTWCRLQAVNPNCPLKLCWNLFVPNPSPEVTSSWIFVRILDPSFNYVYTTNFVPPDVTNICVPACTLSAGETYQIQLLFSDRADDVNYGFESDAPATAGFDELTYTSLITLPPALCIAPGTNAVVLNWSIAASNFALESTGNLSSGNWCPVTNTPTVVNNTNYVVLPTCGSARFFQLYQVSQP